MEKELILCPDMIATGKVTREQLTNLIYKAATACNLDPIEKLRFYRELEKAAGDAVKLKDPDYDKSIDRAAADFAETLEVVQEALAEDKKEFEYKNCRYQYKDKEIVVDMSDTDVFKGKDAVDWRKQKIELLKVEGQMKDLKAAQKKIKNNMDIDVQQYIEKHNNFNPEVEHYIAVV